VTRTSGYRLALLAGGFALAFAMAGANSQAAIDLAVGARNVVKNEPVSDCNSKAKTALNAVLQNAAEIGSGDTGEWEAYGANDSSGHPSAAAAIHCYPLDNGYVVTFTCAAQMPPNPESASALCTKLAAAFDSRAQASTTPATISQGRLR
jgi:hypothetical protein